MVRAALALPVVLALLNGCSAERYRVPWEVASRAQAPQVRAPLPAPPSIVVQRGDTVYGISRRYGIPMKAIIRANDLNPPYVLRVGQRLTLPRPRIHVVERGDTLYAIARRYGVDVNALARVNHLRPPYLIQVNERLIIPEKEREPEIRTAALPSPKPAEPSKDTARTSKTAAAGKVVDVAAKKPPVRAVQPPQPPARAGGSFQWPLEGKVISRFGPKRNGTRNDGINIAAPRGTPVRAAENGVVVYAGNELQGFGNLLLIKHDGGWMTAYAHNERLVVKRGATVRRGQVVARVGSSGNVTRPQLHFELRKGTKAVIPLKHLNRVVASAR